MLTLPDIAYGALLPAVVAGGIALAGWRAGGDHWPGGPALALAYAAGHAGLFGWPPLPAGEASQWIVYLGLAAIVPSLVDALQRPPRARLRWPLRLVLIGSTFILLLQPRIEYAWGAGATVAWLVGLTLIVLAYSFQLDLVLPGLSGATGWLALWLPAAGATMAVAASGSLLLGQLAGVLAAGIAGLLVSALVAGRRSVVAADLPPAAILLSALLTCAYFYSELPATSVLLLLAAPAGAVVPDLVSRSRDAPWVNAARVGIIVVTVVIAVTVAALSGTDSGY